jgi:chromosome segregation ATPase
MKTPFDLDKIYNKLPKEKTELSIEKIELALDDYKPLLSDLDKIENEGKSIKKELDKLEPKFRKLRNELGKLSVRAGKVEDVASNQIQSDVKALKKLGIKDNRDFFDLYRKVTSKSKNIQQFLESSRRQFS